MCQLYGHRWFPLVTVLILSSLFLAGQGFPMTTVIQVKYRWASEALPIVKHFLSSNGIVTVDKRTNSLIVTDTEEVVLNIQKYLNVYDVPAKRVRIRLKLNQEKTSRDRELSVRGNVSKDNWRVVIGDSEEEGIEVKAKDEQKEEKQSQEYIVNTISGNKAYILTGTRIPYRQRWRQFCHRYGGCPETITFHDADTGMEITPVVVGNHANIEITPRISQVDTEDPRGIIRFATAATRLTVPLGQWVTIGGTDKKGNDVLREILAGGSGENSDTLSMSIMVETY